MGLDYGRYFLLSLLVAPACTGRTVDEDDGGEPEPQRELGDGCRALFELYSGCYDYEDYETGYATESGGSYDPADYCDYLGQEFQQYYGEPCARAQDDIFACIAKLDCAGLETDWVEACPEEVERAHANCPEVFPACECSEYASSDNSCGIDCAACLDGNTYAADCTTVASDGTVACTCRRNGEVTVEFSEVGDSCFDVSALVEDRCMFP